MREYDEEDFLSLSGIQHYAFCMRQWALIHIEQQWAENLRTVEGEIMHDRAHNQFFNEKRGDIITSRGIAVHSARLGINGVCDIVEFCRDTDGVPLYGKDGLYKVYPVEYKRGSPKDNDCDELQLAAQALCLEEMLCCRIDTGFLYYGETRRRVEVKIDDELRNRVEELAKGMHALYARRHTPKVKPSKSCNACSLKDICLPVLCKNTDVREYIERKIGDDSA